MRERSRQRGCWHAAARKRTIPSPSEKAGFARRCRRIHSHSPSPCKKNRVSCSDIASMYEFGGRFALIWRTCTPYSRSGSCMEAVSMYETPKSLQAGRKAAMCRNLGHRGDGERRPRRSVSTIAGGWGGGHVAARAKVMIRSRNNSSSARDVFKTRTGMTKRPYPGSSSDEGRGAERG